jgi:hypothetical protein
MSLYSPPLKEISDEETTVSIEQLDTDETITVYRFFPPEQLPTRLKTPTLEPGSAVVALKTGVVTWAHPVDPPLLPPPPGLPF